MYGFINLGWNKNCPSDRHVRIMFVKLFCNCSGREAARFILNVATNGNLSCDWLVSVSCGKRKIYRKALLFTSTNRSAPSVHYVIYMSWCSQVKMKSNDL